MKILGVKTVADKIKVLLDDNSELELKPFHGIMVCRNGCSGISLVKKLQIGDEILDLNPDRRNKAS
jgi:hypothetical protein